MPHIRTLSSLSLLLLLAYLPISCSQDTPAKIETQATPVPTPKPAITLEEFGWYLTQAYKKTPWEVSVFGDSATSSVVFDCSDDPHPEDVCFMLYKKYPGEDERAILRMMGVKRLFFRAGFTKKSWEKRV